MSDQAVGRTPRNRFDLWLLMLAALNLYLLNASNMVFMDPDEVRCVMIAREMLTKGDYLVPHLVEMTPAPPPYPPPASDPAPPATQTERPG